MNNTKTFAENARALKAATRELLKLSSQINLGGGEQSIARQRARGKLLARERIDLLLDAGSPFLELGKLAAHNVYETPLPAAGLITGVGWIAGRPCMITANDSTVKGGAYYPLTVKKHLRAQEIARRCRLPCVYLVDSGGAYLEGQAEVFPDRDHFGRIFRNQARMSADGVFQLAVVLGSCTAGGAYIPAMADECIIAQGGSIYLAGPPLVEAATGERADSETLGGAKVHAQQSGLADHYANDEREALSKARAIIKNLGEPPCTAINNDAPPPKHSQEELYGVIGTNLRRPANMREVLMRIADDSVFDEFKPQYGETLITGHIRIGGKQAAVLANNGALFSQSALKGAHFVQLACKRKTPLVFLQNITGFMVGARYESEGIAKHGAKLVAAVSCAQVPKITIIIGGSYGAGNYAMCGRAFDPDFLFTLPCARVAVMGGEQAAEVMRIIKSQKAKLSAAEARAMKKKITAQFEKESHPFYGSARLWDDGVIDPAQTREVLMLALAASANKPQTETRFGVFRM